MKPVKDVPILMSGPMARAIIDGNKTETRRLVKPQPEIESGYEEPHQDEVGYFWKQEESHEDFKAMVKFMLEHCPYGVAPGRRFWVKETYYPAFKRTKSNSGCVYRADQIAPCLALRPDWHPGGKGWKPSIFMPRWASRTELLSREIKVERLHDITDAGAKAEGIQELPLQKGQPGAWWTADPSKGAKLQGRTPRQAYIKLWELINGKDSWDPNPWVWVIKFKKVS